MQQSAKLPAGNAAGPAGLARAPVEPTSPAPVAPALPAAAAAALRRGTRLHALPQGSRPQDLPEPWSRLAWQPLAGRRHGGKPRLFYAMYDGAMQDGATQDGAMQGGAVHDGAVHDGAVRCGRLVVCKDGSDVRGLFARGWRRWALRNEARALAALSGQPGVPVLLARWPSGLVLSLLPGRLLSSFARGSAPPAVLDALDALLGEIHARGVGVADVHRRNVLVADDGSVALVDFELACTAASLRGRLLGGLVRRLDRLAAARQRAYHGLPLGPAHAEALVRAPWAYRAFRRWKRVRRALQRGAAASRRWGGRSPAGALRVAAAAALLAALALLSRPTPASVLAGAPFVALGMAWRAWAAGHLLKSRELAVSGPYRHVRHPLYFGRLCLLTGFCVMAWTPWPAGPVVVPLNAFAYAGVLAVFFGYYLPRKRRVEGARLAAWHGEAYHAWARHVPEILPRLRPHGVDRRAWSRERFLDNREGLMLAAMAGLAALFAWRAGLAG